MWASTLCPLSNSTRNMALGSGSTTAPSTSIASFFATPQLSFSETAARAPMRKGGEPKRPPTEAEATVYGGCRASVTPRVRHSAASVTPRVRHAAAGCDGEGFVAPRSAPGGEDLGAVGGEGDGVLEVGAQ